MSKQEAKIDTQFIVKFQCGRSTCTYEGGECTFLSDRPFALHYIPFCNLHNHQLFLDENNNPQRSVICLSGQNT